jgi:hypothetical protein
MPDATDPVLRELIEARTALAATVAKMRRRNRLFIASSVLTLVFLVFYLGYAAKRFGGDVTPDLVAANLAQQFHDSLPEARIKLEKSLRDNAPSLIDAAFDQVQAMPAKYAGDLQAEATKRMDDALPGVEDQMYESMKQALDKSKAEVATAAGPNDEAKLQSTLKAVSVVYADETMRFVDQTHATYSADATTFTDYMERLATSPNLDHRDQLHREMFRTVFALVRERALSAPPTTAP